MSIPQIKFTATIPPKDGAPEDAGAISHEFLASTEDLARELCLAQGWRFDGKAYPLEPTVEPLTGESWKKEETPPRRRPRRKAADKPETTSNPPLTKKQIQALVITARQAFDHLESFGLIEVEGKTKTARLDAWRAEVCKQVTGRKSFRELRNSHYRPLRAELLKLAGKPYDEPKTLVHGRQSENRQDTMEAREQLIERIEKELQAHAESDHETAGQVGEAYVMTVAKRKNPKVTLSDFASLVALRAKALEDLFFTIRNRIASKEERGSSIRRNKKQRGDES